MNLSFSSTSTRDLDVDLLALVITDPAALPDGANSLDEEWGGVLRRELGRGRIRAGKPDSAIVTGGEGGPQRVLLVSPGPFKHGRAEALRTAGARVAATARAQRCTSVALLAPDGDDAADDLAALVEGFTLGAYRFDRFKTNSAAQEEELAAEDDTSPREQHPGSLEVTGAVAAARTAAEHAYTVARATNWARDLANCPANYLTPEMMADEARELAERHEHLSFRALDRAAIVAEGMGLLAAVAQGSANEPRLMVLEWNPPGVDTADSERLALVGKAVTFDTGGISIKPSAGMTDMRMDKSGGCAVLGAMRAIAELGVPRRVLAIVGATENMPGGRAYKPGDVITAMDGTSVEVTNTDAEGRLVLGDAICFARKLGCGRIVEISTLTGAMVIALGHHYTGLVAREDSDLAAAALAAARRTGDHAWHLPMHDAYRGGLKSDCADMVNSGGRAGGSLYAALFLEHFAKDTPFVHLDVAGTAMLPKPQGVCTVRGASGWGVRLFVDLAGTA